MTKKTTTSNKTQPNGSNDQLSLSARLAKMVLEAEANGNRILKDSGQYHPATQSLEERLGKGLTATMISKNPRKKPIS